MQSWLPRTQVLVAPDLADAASSPEMAASKASTSHGVVRSSNYGLVEARERDVAVEALEGDGCLRDRHPRRVVAVQQVGPPAVDGDELVAVEQRVAAVDRGDLRVERGDGRPRLGQVLRQSVGDVDAEPVHPAVGPEGQRPLEVDAHLLLVPVEVRLLGREEVEVPLAVRRAGPARGAEV